MTFKPRPRTGPFLASVAACAFAACDSSATIYDTSASFEQLQFVSAWPAKKRTDGSWERMCGTGIADGLITNMVFRSTGRNDDDRDVSLRPRDVIKARAIDGGSDYDINLSNPDNMALALGCINPVDATGSCQGAEASASIDQVRFNAHTADRSVGHNVLVLIDQSASVTGLVQDGTFEETKDETRLPPNLRDVASDFSNERHAAAKDLIRSLNSRDMPGAIAFSEAYGLVVPCSQGGAGLQADLEACFGRTNRGIWVDGIEALPGNVGGRSNLWLAVKTGYDFLRAKNDRLRSNHIIVLTDGPDTCAGENRTECEAQCSTADFGALSDQIEADHADPNAPKIHIHFIQFESLGYPGRDPRQVELSCVSGGHYQFINSNQFPRENNTGFRASLQRAMFNLRYTLMGHWEVASTVPVYASNAGGGAGVPAGDLYGLEGALTIRRSANLSSTEKTYPFGYGIEPNADQPTIAGWDRRPTVRKPCGGFADCGAGSDPGACEVVCSPETLVCANGSAAVTMPDLAVCQGSGFCCAGECQTAGQCAACTGN